jgi:acyl-CoA dehydrogenase
MSADAVDLLLETAHAVFARDTRDGWSEVERAGLLELPEMAGLGEIAAVVRVSAYHATELDFAERVLLEPLRVAGAGPDELRLRGALMRSVQMVGAMERILALTVAYASERHQFGQPLNRFQAIQQLVATLAAEVALAAAALDAVLADPTPRRIGIAKIAAGRSAGVVAAIAHQVHGAIGFTQEHQLHRFTTRLWRWRDEYGTEAAWSESLGFEIATAGPDATWVALTSAAISEAVE